MNPRYTRLSARQRLDNLLRDRGGAIGIAVFAAIAYGLLMVAAFAAAPPAAVLPRETFLPPDWLMPLVALPIIAGALACLRFTARMEGRRWARRHR